MKATTDKAEKKPGPFTLFHYLWGAWSIIIILPMSIASSCVTGGPFDNRGSVQEDSLANQPLFIAQAITQNPSSNDAETIRLLNEKNNVVKYGGPTATPLFIMAIVLFFCCVVAFIFSVLLTEWYHPARLVILLGAASLFIAGYLFFYFDELFRYSFTDSHALLYWDHTGTPLRFVIFGVLFWPFVYTLFYIWPLSKKELSAAVVSLVLVTAGAWVGSGIQADLLASLVKSNLIVSKDGTLQKNTSILGQQVQHQQWTGKQIVEVKIVANSFRYTRQSGAARNRLVLVDVNKQEHNLGFVDRYLAASNDPRETYLSYRLSNFANHVSEALKVPYGEKLPEK